MNRKQLPYSFHFVIPSHTESRVTRRECAKNLLYLDAEEFPQVRASWAQTRG